MYFIEFDNNTVISNIEYNAAYKIKRIIELKDLSSIAGENTLSGNLDSVDKFNNLHYFIVPILDTIYQIVIFKRNSDLIEEYLNEVKDFHLEVFSKGGENEEKYLNFVISDAYKETILFLLKKLEK